MSTTPTTTTSEAIVKPKRKATLAKVIAPVKTNKSKSKVPGPDTPDAETVKDATE